MSDKDMYLTQGDAFNLESACSFMQSHITDEGVRKTFHDLEERLRQHQGMIVGSRK